jgi:7,8-dihydropterin-6-yl-methyl-4-(beta-D-ribofuranosyl)aminobenzene 5'-phosphate synthase
MSSKPLRVAIFLLIGIVLTPPAHATDLRLTIIYDNNPYKDQLETRWGFSCLVEGLEKTILFDVGGEGAILLGNMEKLQIDPGRIDVVVLSHIHYDHIGGLSDLLERNPDIVVYLPKSFPKSVKKEVQDAGASFVEVRKPEKVCTHAYSTGELGDWIKEQSLIIETSKGLVIITGCAHPGIVQIVQRAKSILRSNAYLVLGGFHLCWMNGQQINRIIRGIRREAVRKVAPCHCSGDLAREEFQKAYGEEFILVGAGKIIEIEDAF